EHGAASTYSGLGVLAGVQNHFVESGRWLVRAIVGFSHQHDSHEIERNVNNFLIIYKEAPPADQAQLRQMWEEAGLGPLFSTDQDSPAAAREERIEEKPAKAGLFKSLLRKLLK
ncbi:MAG: hypothetical protein V7849_18410, partial [Candidatus Competibacter sp.]